MRKLSNAARSSAVSVGETGEAGVRTALQEALGLDIVKRRGGSGRGAQTKRGAKRDRQKFVRHGYAAFSFALSVYRVRPRSRARDTACNHAQHWCHWNSPPGNAATIVVFWSSNMPPLSHGCIRWHLWLRVKGRNVMLPGNCENFFTFRKSQQLFRKEDDVRFTVERQCRSRDTPDPRRPDAE